MKSVKKKTAAQEREELLYKIAYFLLCVFLILMDTAVGTMSYVALAITAIAVFFGRDDFAMQNLVFLMPFAVIFKNNPDATSFYTYLLLLYVAKNLIYGKRFPGYILVFFIYLAAIQVVTNTFNALRSVKLFANLLFIYYAYNERDIYRKTDLYTAFVLGFTLASLVAYLDSSVFRIRLFLANIDHVGEHIRYSGLNADANFYSISVVVALVLLLILHQKKKLPDILIGAIAVILTYCAFNTYSKSALLMLTFPVFLFMYLNHKEQKALTQLMLIGVLIVFAVNLAAGRIEALSVVLDRFGNEGNSLDSLTTGRTRLWRIYLQYYAEHPVSTLFGFGLGADLKIDHKGAHNIYIDMIYYIGLIGEVWMFGLLDAISKERRDLSAGRSILNYSINIVIAIMYFFLPGLFDFQLPIFLLLGFLVLEGDAKPQDAVRKKGWKRRASAEAGTGEPASEALAPKARSASLPLSS